MPDVEVDFGGADSIDAQLAALVLSSGAAASNGEAKRLIKQGAVSINGEKAAGPTAMISDGDVLRVGKRQWRRIRAAGG